MSNRNCIVLCATGLLLSVLACCEIALIWDVSRVPELEQQIDDLQERVFVLELELQRCGHPDDLPK